MSQALLGKSVVMATADTYNARRIAYSLADASRVTGIPKNTLRDAHKRGEFAAVKRCGRWMVTHAALLEWLTPRPRVRG